MCSIETCNEIEMQNTFRWEFELDMGDLSWLDVVDDAWGSKLPKPVGGSQQNKLTGWYAYGLSVTQPQTHHQRSMHEATSVALIVSELPTQD
jgi:hypothetical protein